MRLGAVHQVAKFRRLLSQIAYGLDSITAPDSFSAERLQIFHYFFTTAVCFAAILSASLMSQW
jgi:hypothetical protein